EQWQQYLRDPSSVSSEWREYFAELERREGRVSGERPTITIGRAQLATDERPGGEDCERCGRDAAMAELQHRVDELIRNYRVRGHRAANVDPLGAPHWVPPELDPAFYGFTDAELDLEFRVSALSDEPLPLRLIIERLRATYTGAIGVQFMHIDDLQVRQWLEQRMEGSLNRIELDRATQMRILERLTDAVMFERFVQRKFVGAKSFSLEGAESLIPLLDLAFDKAGDHGIDEVVLGMPHRGRLNVLANIMGKRPAAIFREFEDRDAKLQIGGGDVKYHQGFHRNWRTAAGAELHVALMFNPSHLEFVNPVAMGRLRAKQDRSDDWDRELGLLVLVHGDAAFIGEGIVQESLNLSQLDGYSVGGALHVVINNQIGFTTPPEQGRSSTYATDVAKMLQVPIFHLNGESPEAVAQAVSLALDFRRRFKRDVVIDMYCYRRRGHNEGDEPTFTQPAMYQAIKQRKTVREGYLEHLLELGEVARDEADRIASESKERLEQEFELTDDATPGDRQPTSKTELGSIWAHYRGGPDTETEDVDTGYSRERLSELLEQLIRVPDGFVLHAKLRRLFDVRAQMAAGSRPLDWAAGEALALATLAVEGVRVRLTGQDSERGTFSHRHAVLHDLQSGEPHEPFNQLAASQGFVEIRNSPLSEAAALGFEAGYAVACPDGLVIWEAQFGDFVNAAQVIIDQFIATSEDKWKSLSGLTILLPHGLEGTGPEHASARLERFLQLAAEDNIQVVYPTTPAQIFHVLRRQVIRPWRKPLVVMSPKSMLRNPLAVSSLDELARGRFRRVIGDASIGAQTERVVLCSGKFYYDLVRERERLGRDDVAIVRVEQLYPLEFDELAQALAPYPDGKPLCWVQEEPWNMGAWPNIKLRLADRLAVRWPLREICREESASPATGSAASHKLEQQELLDRAFGAE
ncbi:MAG: 2-oxoglutarate dehydrogenase E1 component, partial [Deltaproteobacteria bacterium]|nr:2-oxoglutarate dehydrogenase E1 component [Deltaproteobacteria bacterium]